MYNLLMHSIVHAIPRDSYLYNHILWVQKTTDFQKIYILIARYLNDLNIIFLSSINMFLLLNYFLNIFVFFHIKIGVY